MIDIEGIQRIKREDKPNCLHLHNLNVQNVNEQTIKKDFIIFEQHHHHNRDDYLRFNNSTANKTCNKKTELRIKLNKALSIINTKTSQDGSENGERSKYFQRRNAKVRIEVDLKLWEEFYANYIGNVFQTFNANYNEIGGVKICNKCDEIELAKVKFKVEEEEAFCHANVKLEDCKTNFSTDWVCTNDWIPPRSPHNLIEETLYNNPWALLVSTIFLNRTSCTNARPYLMEFFKNYPDPESVLNVKSNQFEIYFKKLGLMKKRSEQVWRMSYDYLNKNWKNVNELYGIGKYGEDAFKMFCLGDFNVEPNDRFLKIYKAWYQIQRKRS